MGFWGEIQASWIVLFFSCQPGQRLELLCQLLLVAPVEELLFLVFQLCIFLICWELDPSLPGTESRAWVSWNCPSGEWPALPHLIPKCSHRMAPWFFQCDHGGYCPCQGATLLLCRVYSPQNFATSLQNPVVWPSHPLCPLFLALDDFTTFWASYWERQQWFPEWGTPPLSSGVPVLWIWATSLEQHLPSPSPLLD